jgi:hypothetical protein
MISLRDLLQSEAISDKSVLERQAKHVGADLGRLPAHSEAVLCSALAAV